MADREEIVTLPISSAPRRSIADIADPDAAVVVVRASERYARTSTLGAGGMGEVHLCRDRLIGREVAMKVVSDARAARSELHARFVREARVQAQLEHPAIVPVYDFGVDEGGDAWFTMKRVRGVTLAQVLEAQTRGEMLEHGRHRLLAGFVQVCRAIDYAHEHGVLHRDLKPANVMLGPYGEVYVLDWGLAKVRSASRDLDARVEGETAMTGDATAAGTVFGTPGYMAPEQVLGRDADERTDVYLLGAILFEVLAGAPLHGEGTAEERMKRAVAGVETRPSIVSPGADVSPELDSICVHACARHPQERFTSARELADTVEAYLSGDRDVELRRALAGVHLSHAREAASRASVPGASADERRAALAEAGRAVALAPDDREARQMLLEVLTQAPGEPPREVVEHVEHEARLSQYWMLPRVALLFVTSWVLVFVAVRFIGVRDARLIALACLPWMYGAAHMMFVHRFRAASAVTQRVFTVVNALAVALTAVFYGPAIITPTLAVVLAFGSILQQQRSGWRFTGALYTLAIAIPTALTLLGLLPVRYDMVGEQLVVSPGALALSPLSVLIASSGMNALFLYGGIRFAVRYREATTKLSLSNHLLAWQLRHLVPEETARAMSTAPEAV